MFARTFFLLIIISSACFASNPYSEGFKAYLDQDYVEAQSQWLQSAKQGDAKSMFNLGLLHEQGKIDNADTDKANEWYRLAGNAGYSPANYYLALALKNESKGSNVNKEEVLTLMKKAASKGFAPAIEYINRGVNPSLVAKKTTDLVAKKQDTSNEKVRGGYLSEAWVKAKKPSYWTIQMLAFSEEAKVQAFIDQNSLRSKAAYFKEGKGGDTVYKLIYGAYKTKVQADFARQNLTKDLAQHGPWLRTIKSVQSVIKAQ